MSSYERMARISLVRGLLGAWVALMLTLSLFFGAGHYFGFARDSDTHDLSEAFIFPLFVFGLPMAGLCIGVLWPWFAAMRELGAFRRVWTGAVAAVSASAPMFVAFFLGGRLPGGTRRTLLEDIRAVIDRPQWLPVVFGFFVLAGLAVWLASGLAAAPRRRVRVTNSNAPLV